MDNMGRGIAARSAPVQKALNSVKAATESVTAANAAHAKQMRDAQGQAERLELATENVTAAKRREENATLRVTEAEYALNKARKASNVDAEKMAILEERVEAAKRNEENATLAVRKAIEDEAVAKRNANSENDRLIISSERLSAARRKEADAHRSAASTLRNVTNDMRKARDVGSNMSDSIQEIGTTSLRVGRGLATIGAPAALLGLLKVGQTAIGASQSLLLLPAAASAAAAGIGTLSLATAGFGDAIENIRDPEKFAEGLALLGPNAQQAALSIQNLLPQFDALKYATQDAFFAGIGEQIHRLSNEFLPEVQTLTTNIAGSFNQMMTGLSNQLMTPTNMANIQTIFDNISQTFVNMGPGVQAFTQAMIDLTTVGSTFLPQLSTGFSNLMLTFSDFIGQAAADGSLQEWMQEGIASLQILGEALWNIGTLLFEAFAPQNMEQVNELGNSVNAVVEIVGLLTLNTQVMGETWRNELDSMHGPLGTFRDAIMDIPEAFMWVVRKVVEGMDFMGRNFTNFMNQISPFADKTYTNLADSLPTGGDWGGHDMPGSPERARQDGVKTPPNWTNPTTGQRMKWEVGKGYVPLGPVRPTPPGNQTAGLGGYPGPFGVPAPPGEKGAKPSDRERRDAIIASLDPSLYKVDPYAQVPGLPAVPGALRPGDPAMYQAPGYQKDPQAVLEAQQDVERKAHDLEEARKERLALERDNTATAEAINDAKWKELKAGQDLQREQVDLSEKIAGSAKDVKDKMGELGVALDPDLGLSKGLAGFAEFMVKFLGNMAAAPMLANLQGIVDADPLKGGHGLMGILGAQNIASGKSPILGRPLTPEQQAAYYDNGSTSTTTTNGTPSTPGSTGSFSVDPNTVGMPSILQDTGSVSSGPQSRTAAAMIQQLFGSQIQGKIGGSRDENTAPNTHDAGLSIDIPIAESQRGPGGLGDQIEAWLQQNAQGLGLKYSIWRNQGKYPGQSGTGFTAGGHQDHIDAHFNGQGGTGQFTGAGGYGAYSGPSSASFAGGSIPLPLPVTIVGGGFGGASMPTGGGSMGFPGAVAGLPTTPIGAAPGAGAEGWRQTVAAVVDQYGPQMGVTAANRNDWIDRIVKQIDTESSGNAGAQNPSDSNGQGGTQSVNGLLQYLPSTYAATGGKLTGRPYMDPIGQIAGALFAQSGNGVPSGIGNGSGWAPNTQLPTSITGGRGESPMLGNTTPGVIGRGAGRPGGPVNPFGPGMPMPGQVGPPSSPMGPAPSSVGPFPAPMSVANSVAGMPFPAMPGGLATTPTTPAGGPGTGPTQIGGVGPPAGGGGGGPGGVGLTPGGTLDSAIGAAAAGLDVIAPGAGQAAQMGIKLANRAIQYGGQLAAIGVSGLMETFLPTGGSELANNSWFTKIAGGLAGGIPSIPNTAGGKGGQGTDQPQPPLTPNQAQQPGAPGSPGPGNNPINVEYNNVGATEDRAGRDLAHHLGNMHQGAMR
jgi:hypothetical protein